VTATARNSALISAANRLPKHSGSGIAASYSSAICNTWSTGDKFAVRQRVVFFWADSRASDTNGGFRKKRWSCSGNAEIYQNRFLQSHDLLYYGDDSRKYGSSARPFDNFVHWLIPVDCRGELIERFPALVAVQTRRLRSFSGKPFKSDGKRKRFCFFQYFVRRAAPLTTFFLLSVESATEN